MTSTPETPMEPAAEQPTMDEARPAPAAVIPDPALLQAHELALAALREITPDATIGDAAGYRVEPDGVVSLRFVNRLGGYPGWYWTVSLARVADAGPTVLEVELLPGEGALLAPDWVPWAVRLAEYHAAQAALAESPHADDDAEEAGDAGDDLDDVEDMDASDFDDDGSSILHAGDVDGVDIDEMGEDSLDDEDDLDVDVADDDEDSDEDSDDDDDYGDEDDLYADDDTEDDSDDEE